MEAYRGINSLISRVRGVFSRLLSPWVCTNFLLYLNRFLPLPKLEICIRVAEKHWSCLALTVTPWAGFWHQHRIFFKIKTQLQLPWTKLQVPLAFCYFCLCTPFFSSKISTIPALRALVTSPWAPVVCEHILSFPLIPWPWTLRSSQHSAVVCGLWQYFCQE